MNISSVYSDPSSANIVPHCLMLCGVLRTRFSEPSVPVPCRPLAAPSLSSPIIASEIFKRLTALFDRSGMFLSTPTVEALVRTKTWKGGKEMRRCDSSEGSL